MPLPRALPMLLLAALALLAGCAAPLQRPPETADATDIRRHDLALIERGGDFRREVVGRSFGGDRAEIVIAPGGALIGTYDGRPFAGSWEFRRGLFCHSMTPKVRRAPDRTCARPIIRGDTLLLAPVVE